MRRYSVKLLLQLRRILDSNRHEYFFSWYLTICLITDGFIFMLSNAVHADAIRTRPSFYRPFQSSTPVRRAQCPCSFHVKQLI